MHRVYCLPLIILFMSFSVFSQEKEVIENNPDYQFQSDKQQQTVSSPQKQVYTYKLISYKISSKNLIIIRLLKNNSVGISG